MLPFKRILFPIDYSQPCDALVPYVKDAVQHFRAQLTLAHAYGPENLAYGESLLPDPEWSQRVHTLEAARLKNFAAGAFPTLHVELRVKQEEPGTYIHQLVEHEGNDLIMMSTQGHGPLRRFLLGSVAAKVLHDVSAAVWTTTPSALDVLKPGTPYRSILCALDETAEAEAVLKASACLAKYYQAQLTILHAVATPPMSFEIDFSEYRKDLMDTADFKIREMKRRLGIDAPHRITEAPLIQGVQDEARRRNVDLLVLGRGKAQSAIGRFWSNLYPLIRESPCPVLSI